MHDVDSLVWIKPCFGVTEFFQSAYNPTRLEWLWEVSESLID